MNAAWLALCGLGLLAVWLLRDALTDMCKEEIRTRLARLPYAVLRVVALRTPRRERQDVLTEWRAELDFILSETDGLPVTRLLRGIWYSVGLMGLLLPFATARDLIAAYWWKAWKVTHRLRQVSRTGPYRRTVRVPWVRTYIRRATTADSFSMLAAGLLAFWVNVESNGHASAVYLAVTLALPMIWLIAVQVAGGYDERFFGSGTEEFRRILAAGLSLTGCVAVIAWVTQIGVSRSYVLIALPVATAINLVARYTLRKELHKRRAAGRCMSNVLAVGHESAVADLVCELRRDPYHGLKVVAACVPQPSECAAVAGVPVFGGLDDVVGAVRTLTVDSVAVLACPEMDGLMLRQLAWELEKTGTELCVAPALLDVTGARTTVRPTAGLSLLHVDHPQLSGPRTVLKEAFDRVAAGLALILLSPLLGLIALAIRLSDDGPALFTQTRVGKNGRPFKVYKFRTMVVDAEKRLAELRVSNDYDGVLFKMRHDPRITAIGARLRKWSVDELPQLINVVRGEMSLVGPRAALPDEAARYADHVRRRLVVKPGLTGMWQVNGRSDLSWEETVRLDLRYVENWSFALDLQILWKTFSVILRGSGAY